MSTLTAPDAWLTGPELDEHFKITASTRYKLNGLGLPRIMVGAQARYRLSEVQAWLESRGRRGDAPELT